MKISDRVTLPFLKQHIYFTNSSLFIEESEPPAPFWENFEN